MSVYAYSADIRDRNVAPKRGMLLGSIMKLAGQRKTWSPALLAGVLGRGLLNMGRHREIMRVLRLPVFAELTRENARFAFKYLTQGYLCRSLTVAQRAACFVHHYRYLQQNLPAAFVQQLLRRHVVLFAMREENHAITVTFGLSNTHDKEGELSLHLVVDGEIVAVLSFTIVPGEITGSAARDVLFITRIQGMRGYYALVSAATRAARNVAPSALLLAALQGVATTLGVTELAGVCASEQSSYTLDSAVRFQDAYDDFYTRIGIARNETGFYASAIPLGEKPLSQIKKGHKIRTREKRAFKQQVSSHAQGVLVRMIEASSFVRATRQAATERLGTLENSPPAFDGLLWITPFRTD